MPNLVKRYLCWDENLIEKQENMQLLSHKPERKNIALRCDDAWEGIHNGYGGLVKVGDTYRIYYRAYPARTLVQNVANAPYPSEHSESVCLAESRDGITFTKPCLEKYEFYGTKANNIVYNREEENDNFSVFYDENPDCPEEERFKALSAYYINNYPYLRYYASRDGYDFTYMRDLPLTGVFDSYQTIVWDKKTKQYFIYYRNYHAPDGSELPVDGWEGTAFRDVRVATSKDFVHFEEHGQIRLGGESVPEQLYTNQIVKYFRDESTFIGFPVRYTDRVAEKENYADMPIYDYRSKVISNYGRSGTAQTDCLIMTSSDGFSFDCREEAFMTSGPEGRANWWYGDNYCVYGMALTKSDIEGADDEISMYFPEGYRVKNVNFRRYTIRQDGFFSWFGPYKGADVLTKEIEISGDAMVVNFATSSAGSLRVAICDENGKTIDGYESNVLFGDKVDRPVRFPKSLSALSGKKVRLRFEMKDAHLYSFAYLENK
jgi:hypothetical protein